MLGMKRVSESPPERIGPIPGLRKEAERNRPWWGILPEDRKMSKGPLYFCAIFIQL